MIHNISDYLQSLANPQYLRSAVKVALFLGTVLFMLNHGNSLRSFLRQWSQKNQQLTLKISTCP